jgi:hypothetical protein
VGKIATLFVTCFKQSLFGITRCTEYATYACSLYCFATVGAIAAYTGIGIQHNRTEYAIAKYDCVATSNGMAMCKNHIVLSSQFFKKNVHCLYDLGNGTVCAMIANCNVRSVDVDNTWLSNMRKLVVCKHTDRRNNVIKNIRLRFCGKLNDYLCCNVIAYSHVCVDGFPEGMCVKIPHFKINNGSDAETK